MFKQKVVFKYESIPKKHGILCVRLAVNQKPYTTCQKATNRITDVYLSLSTQFFARFHSGTDALPIAMVQ